MKKIVFFLLLINILFVNAQQKDIALRINIEEGNNIFSKTPEIIYESSSEKAYKLTPFFILFSVSLISLMFVWKRF